MKSPLYEWHVKNNAKLADFGGWEMPIEYPKGIEISGKILPGGTIAEHMSVRERVGVFDVSHLGKLSVKGNGAKVFLNSLLTNDLTKIKSGEAQYNLLCDDSGGVIDDLIVYEISESELFLVPNAANCQAVEAVIKSNAPAEINVINEHESFGVIAIQGPRSKEVLTELNIAVELEYMAFTKIEHPKFGSMIICRTGYTGEFGFELLPTWGATQILWTELVSALSKFDGTVCGLGARDTLRTEMKFPLYGHEIDASTNPLEAGLGWVVKLDKTSDFMGKAALQKIKADGIQRTLIGIKVLERGIARQGYEVFDAEGKNSLGTGKRDIFSKWRNNGFRRLYSRYNRN